MNERRENTLGFLKHLTIRTIRKVSATIQVYDLSNMPLVCLHLHQCWYANITLKITHFSETTKDRNLIFGMSVDAIYIYDQGE
jgi:hypothetical protein